MMCDMLTYFNRIGSIVVLFGTLGCSSSSGTVFGTRAARAVDVLQSHWKALQRRDWRAAYNVIHSEIKKAGFNLQRFTALHARRRESPGFPDDIRVVGSQQMDNSITVSYRLGLPFAGSGVPIVVPPRRKATLRKRRRIMAADHIRHPDDRGLPCPLRTVSLISLFLSDITTDSREN